MCCKGKKNTRHGMNTNYVPGQTFEKAMGNPPQPTQVIAMQPTQAVHMPGALKRVYLGLGWENSRNQEQVDVDASVIAFGGGSVKDAVSFSKLQNASHTLAHTGDVLIGAEDAKLGDMERVYLWLEKMAPDVDMLLLVANIYTDGVDWGSLNSAYVRVTNADTEQELGRMWLGGGGWSNLAAGSNAVVFAKVFRYGGEWMTMALGQPMVVQGASSYEAMLPKIYELGLQYPPPPLGAPVQQPIMVAPGQQQTLSGQQPQKPSKSWICPALAIGTAGGVAAAIAIFYASDSDMSLDMFDPGLFSNGVDFGSLQDQAGAFTGGLSELADGVDPNALGPWAQDAGAAAMDGASGASEWAEGAATGAWDAAGGAIGSGGFLDSITGAFSSVGDFIGDASGGFMDSITGAFSSVGHFIGDALGDGGDGGGGGDGGDGGDGGGCGGCGGCGG
jgi:stress response protein SCP2